MSRARLSIASLALLALIAVMAGGAQSPSAANGSGGAGPITAPYVPGEVLIKFRASARPVDRSSMLSQVSAHSLRAFRSSAEQWRLGPGQTVEGAIAQLRNNPIVAWVEPNYIVQADVTPNDPRFSELYGLHNTGQGGGTADADIDGPEAWGISTGSHSVLVGVIDTGIDYNHPDLSANVWTNPVEDPAQGGVAGVDDDNNGFVDDIHGYDFINNDGDPIDDNGHGTHVSGTIGAVGNNGVGVVGVNWQVSIMGLKFLSSGGSGSTADAIRAVEYATMMGVDLTSNSWGGGGFSQGLFDAIAAANAAEIAFVAAAGNSASNNDVSPHYPSSFNVPNVFAVAATNNRDLLASFSSFGATSVDIGAPGEDIMSTLPGGQYGLNSGTSMATPHVSGVLALIRSVNANIPVAQMKTVLFAAATPLASLAGRCVTGGRLNAFFAIATPDTDPPGGVIDLATENPGSNTMGLTWTATGDDGSVGTATFYEVRYSTDPIDDTNFDAATRAGNEPVPQPSGSTESMEVRGLAASTLYYFALKAFDEWGNPGLLSNIATGTTLPPPTVGFTPASINDALFTGQTSRHTITLRNDGVGTLDFEIPTPSLSAPTAAPAPPVYLDKGEVDPRGLPPVIQGVGGPDPFGYRWIDSDEPGGPVFIWQDISGTGTALGVTADDSLSSPQSLGFNFPLYGTFFSSLRVSSNGWLSFTSTVASGAPSYSNQPLPSTGVPENLVAPFFDDLNPNGADTIYFQAFPTHAIVQWQEIPRYQEAGSSLTFQAILEDNGTITYQYLTLTGTTNSTTVGLQNADRTVGLQVAFNQTYLHDNLAIRINAIPQWLTVSPTSGRLGAGQSIDLTATLDAGGLEGGTYPGQIRINNNDPVTPTAIVDVTLVVTGAPDATVQPATLDYGDSFVGLPRNLTLTVANVGTDTLHVTGISTSSVDLAVNPASFDVPAHGSQNVTVTLTPSALGGFSGSLEISSDDAGQPVITVPISANVIPAPIVVVDPTSLTETLYSGNTSSQTLRVTNAGGSDLIINTAADQGNGALGIGPVVTGGPSTLRAGGPDAFGYRYRDSDEPGGPAFNFVDISSTGTAIPITGDDQISAAIPMGISIPFYGNSFSSLKVCTNGFITFDAATTSCPFTNGTLPSTSLPANSVALFWDDLDFRGVQKARYRLDGNRFIVQFTAVDRITAGSSLTFQAQLYTDGRIQAHYQTMTSPALNSAAIGIQNGTRTIGLQVVNNAAYMHNNLAIQYVRIPDWLTVTPANATIPAGQYADFTVGFSSVLRQGGVLNGNVVLNTNIPSQSQVLVPATLTVIGAPQVAVSPASISYGTVFTGFPQLRTFQVINNGTAVLNVSDVDATDPALTVESPVGPTAAFTLDPGRVALFSLRWDPTVAGPLSANVRVHSDDPVSPTKLIPVTGNAIIAPVAVHSPASFTESLNAGDIVTRSLHLENQGGSNLTFSTSLRGLGIAPPVYEVFESKKEIEYDPRPVVLGSGGPDLFGYRWNDSDEPGGPAFAWTDISGIGTPVAGLDSDDENAGPVAIGFPFPFYGNSFSSVRVSTNGWISFTNTTSDLSNDPLPNTGSPENLIAAFHDDLHFRGVERARTYNDGTRFIVQYTNVDRFATGSNLTFQIILYPNGRIVCQYLSMAGVLNSSTVGIQNATQTDGLTVVFDGAYIHDNLAVAFRPPVDYLSVSPATGTIPPGGFADLDVRIDASSLIGGDYAASIDLSTNDPLRGLIGVPVNLHVTGIPDIEVQPLALTFPTTFVGFTASLPATVCNRGTDTLDITSATINGEFSMSGLTAPVSLSPGQCLAVTVTYGPIDSTPHEGRITILSDDPDEPEVLVSLDGTALVPPEIVVTPASIITALPPAGSRTKTLIVRNDGRSNLSWSTTPNIISGAVVTPGSYIELAKGEQDPRVGILGHGGPDAFGYRWRDSDEPGGPVFDWTDISGVGTPINNLTGDDQNSGPIPIGFPFPFYGSTFSDVYAVTNGWLSFTSTDTEFSNQPLPNSAAAVPENLLAVFWDDLHFRSAVHAHYYNAGSRFIVQYTDVDRFSTLPPSPAHLTFQVILYPNGRIVYQYLTTTAVLDSATIGIQNGAKSDGLTVAFNTAYLHNNMAIEFTHVPDWLSVSPTSGTIPAGSRQFITLSMTALGLSDGPHTATVDFTSNDPYTPFVSVPVTLSVGTIPADLFFSPDPLNLIPPPPDDPNSVPLVDTVKVSIELPPPYNIHDVRVNTIKVNDTVPVGADSALFTDMDNDGIPEIMVKFDRRRFEATLPSGPQVTVTVQGEVSDQTWFRGSAVLRVLRPIVTHPDQPDPGDSIITGEIVPITWLAAPATDPVVYDVYLSIDGGATWQELATDLTGTQFNWTVPDVESANALIRVIARDGTGMVGYDTSDEFFTIARVLTPPASVGDSLEVEMSGSDTVLLWKRGPVDIARGPVAWFRIMMAEDPRGPWTQIGTTSQERFVEPLSTPAAGSVRYYKVIAVNSAGETD